VIDQKMIPPEVDSLKAAQKSRDYILAVLSEWLDGGHSWSEDPAWLREWVQGDKEAMEQADAALAQEKPNDR
jgi:hypothetical protein